MFASARSTYESGTKAAPSGRELEAAALFKAARQLEACRREWEAPGRGQRLDEALRYNQRLWTFFQGELSAPDCLLPLELRRNLLQLSGFIDKRTFEMMAVPTPQGLQALIEIDRNIATGLSTPSGAARDIRTA
jgi:flagellar biosynthesis activator protein FlaF